MVSKKSNKPIVYYYNPFFKGDKLEMIEVWQVLSDDVLGLLYPWQYLAIAQSSKRIENLNFLALEQFKKDSANYPNYKFIYKLSSRLLNEGNVQRLATLLSPNLIISFDIYQLEKLGQADALMGLKYLSKRGANIMIEGLERAPIELITVYPVNYILSDYRYFTKANQGVIRMLKQITDTQKMQFVIENVGNINNISMFTERGVEIFSGAAISKPKKRLESFGEGKVEQDEGITADKDEEALKS